MKKLSLAIAMALAATNASADTILGFDATAGVWQPAYSGAIGVDGFDIEEFAPAEDNITFIAAALEHPIPLIPNILVAHSKISTNGMASLEEDIVFNDETYTAGFDVISDIDLTHTDATLYYEILDNWVNLDLGLTARQFDGVLNLEQSCPSDTTCIAQNISEEIELSGVLPMVYAQARFDLPLTGWSIIAQGNATGYNGDSLTDLTAKVRWDFMPAVDFAIEAGYRSMTLEVQELSDLQSDLEISGPYLGLNLHL